jgi:Spy/CpxP family protein refolding chaperone
MKRIIGAATALIALALGLVALTAFRGGCGRHGHGRDPAQVAAFVTDRVDDALDDLDATPEQRTRILAVKDRLLAAGQKARAGHEEARAAVLAEWKAEQPDAARLHALVDARVEEMRSLAHEAVDAGIEVHGVLTPDQRAKVTRKVERWHR